MLAATRLLLLVSFVSICGGTAREECIYVPNGRLNEAPQLPEYGFGNYSSFGPWYSQLPLVYPGGVDGQEDVSEQVARWQVTREPAQEQAAANVRTLLTACVTDAGICIDSLDSFQDLYASLPPEYQPALAKFTASDATFARMRITVAPMMLRQVDSKEALPIDPSSINGLDDIIADTGLSLPELVEQGRVFMQDYTPLEPHLVASPGTFMEIPVGLFFLDGEEGNRLMPLAIKFTVYNDNTYSPKDSSPDWMLAKMAFNSLDTAVHASIHFLLNHFVLENICVSGRRNLAPTHPLYNMIIKPCNLNAAIIAAGITRLLPPVNGTFDRLLMVSGESVATRLLPYYLSEYKWESGYLEADIAERGVQDIPGFAYYQDAKALYEALFSYADTILSAQYQSAARLKRDRQLNAFLSDLSAGGPAEIPGFPDSKDIRSAQDLANVAAQVMWLAGVQHHALNSDKVPDYDFVYPAAPGKIFAEPPKDKGVLTEGELLSNYLLPQAVTEPNGTVIPGFEFFLNTQGFGRLFRIFPTEERRLITAYFMLLPASCGRAAKAASTASIRLSAELAKISTAIRDREAELEGVLPQYLLLDPQNLKFYTAI